MQERRLNGRGAVIFWLFRIVATAVVIAIPTLGVWVGSSLAAYLNGPVVLVCAAGLMLFPIVPVVWAWRSDVRKRRKRKKWDRQILTFWDRVVLRTLVLNLAFLGGMLWLAPDTAFTAVSTRGDWVLDQLEHPRVIEARKVVLGFADRLSWLYEATHKNAYRELIEDDGQPEERPEPRSDEQDPWADPFARVVPDDEGSVSERSKAPPPDAWPQPETLHPAVVSMPERVKGSVAQIGRYIASHESDPYRRVKAVHDFVANHVAYDAVALSQGRYPPQDARSVLKTGLGVCAGYANLLKAIGDASGDEIVVLTGDSRARGGQISGGGHAWNAAKIEGQWYLIDATWDAGSVQGAEFTRRYSTSYLFVPPPVMGVTHFPDDPAWQLRTQPLSRGEFARQPMMRPRFFAEGFTLVSPKRSQVTTDDDFEVQLNNPNNMYLLANFQSKDGLESGRCRVKAGSDAQISCAVPGPGEYQVSLFSSPKRAGTYDWLGDFQVNATR